MSFRKYVNNTIQNIHELDENLSEEKLKQRRYDQGRGKKMRAVLLEEIYKRGGCEFCGLVDHYKIYEWHHIDDTDPTNKRISKLIVRCNHSSLHRELNKVVMLCANCHNKYHQDILCMIDHKHRPDLIPYTHVDGEFYEDQHPFEFKTPNRPLQVLFENEC